MNYNKLMFFIIALGFGSMQLKAENSDFKEIYQKNPSEILDVQPKVSLPIITTIDFESTKIANRHLDLINAIVKCKIECTSDLFIIENNKVTC